MLTSPRVHSFSKASGHMWYLFYVEDFVEELTIIHMEQRYKEESTLQAFVIQ
jgi:hypothetical protein